MSYSNKHWHLIRQATPAINSVARLIISDKRQWFLLTSVTLSGVCSSDDNSGMSENSTGDGVLASSPFVSERKGTVTGRNEAPQASEQAKAAIVDGFNAFTLDTHRALAAGAPAEEMLDPCVIQCNCVTPQMVIVTS